LRTRSDTIIATFHSEQYQPLADITLPRLQQYCKMHKYDLQTEIFKGDMNRIGWERFARVAELLHSYETVMWCDADALITNPTYTLDQFHGPIAMTADLHGANTGVFIARKLDLVRQLFFVINGQFGRDHFSNHPWGEQAAFIHLTSSPPYHELVNWIRQHKLNAYANADQGWPTYIQGQWDFGAFMLQFAGMPLAKRIELAQKYSDQTEKLFDVCDIG
jgi:hypothetical protein